VTTRTKRFLEMEANEQREFLAEELADWTDAGFWPTPRAKTFHRRAKILARSVGMSHAELLDVLRADAEALRDERVAGGPT
jgi:hypothetical protein